MAKPKQVPVALEGVEEIAALDYFIEALQTLRTRRESEVVSEALLKFVDEAEKTGSPLVSKSKKSEDGRARATIKLARKTASQALKAADIRALGKVGIVIDANLSKKLVISKEYTSDQNVLAQIQRLLDKHGDEFAIPQDFITKEAGKTVATDEMLFDVLTLGDMQKIMGVFDHIASIKIAESELLGDKPMAYASRLVKRLIPQVVAEEARAA